MRRVIEFDRTQGAFPSLSRSLSIEECCTWKTGQTGLQEREREMHELNIINDNQISFIFDHARTQLGRVGPRGSDPFGVHIRLCFTSLVMKFARPDDDQKTRQRSRAGRRCCVEENLCTFTCVCAWTQNRTRGTWTQQEGGGKKVNNSNGSVWAFFAFARKLIIRDNQISPRRSLSHIFGDGRASYF